jgi:hypothetical protein
MAFARSGIALPLAYGEGGSGWPFLRPERTIKSDRPAADPGTLGPAHGS